MDTVYFSVGITIFGFILTFVHIFMLGKIGKKDERTVLIRLNINSSRFYTLLICILLILFIDGYAEFSHAMIRNLLISSFVLSLLVGNITALIKKSSL